MRVFAAGAAALLAVGTTSPAWASDCAPIKFRPGAVETTVVGHAPPVGALCYSMAAAAGQRASVEIQGRNMMFSIEGLVEARLRQEFTTDRKTYKILVSQVMRSAGPAPFSLRVRVTD